MLWGSPFFYVAGHTRSRKMFQSSLEMIPTNVLKQQVRFGKKRRFFRSWLVVMQLIKRDGQDHLILIRQPEIYFEPSTAILRIRKPNQLKIEIMRNIISGLVMSLFLMFSLTGCETDNKTLLTDGVWNFQNMTTDSEDETIVSLIALGKALLTDATLEFQEAGTYIITSPLTDDPSTGDWSLIAEQIIMTPDGDELPSTSNIETLTKDKLSYKETFVDGQMNSYKVTTIWTR